MKVLHINTKYRGGGAARAMQRLHDQLLAKGHESKFLIGRPGQANPPLVNFIGDVISEYGTIWESFMSRFGNRFDDLWGIHPWSYHPTLKLPQTEIYKWAQLIDLRNLFGDYLNLWVLPELSRNKPVVWRLPDMWALTGHCAYPYDCQRWITGCYDCPLLTEEGRKIVEPPPTRWDGTERVWRAKKNLYSRSRLHVVVTTSWMKTNVEKSILGNAMSINVISNGVDLEVYQPYEKDEVRRELDLPLDRKILLFAAADLKNLRKGYIYANKAVEKLVHKMQKPPILITMGNAKGIKKESSSTSIRHFGFVRGKERQAKIFAAADLFLCTTLADAQPQTALESMACGTPLVGFDVGPMADLTGYRKRGLLADEITSESLGKVLQEIINQPHVINEMGENCRRKAIRDFDIDAQTNEYIRLYQEILQEKPS